MASVSVAPCWNKTLPAGRCSTWTFLARSSISSASRSHNGCSLSKISLVTSCRSSMTVSPREVSAVLLLHCVILIGRPSFRYVDRDGCLRHGRVFRTPRRYVHSSARGRSHFNGSRAGSRHAGCEKRTRSSILCRFAPMSNNAAPERTVSSMKILVSNDDGYRAPGLAALAAAGARVGGGAGGAPGRGRGGAGGARARGRPGRAARGGGGGAGGGGAPAEGGRRAGAGRREEGPDGGGAGS